MQEDKAASMPVPGAVLEPCALASGASLSPQHSTEAERCYQHFVSSCRFSKNFPTSMASVYQTQQEQYSNHCILDVKFGEKRGYEVPLTVFVRVSHGRVHDLNRCAHLNNKIVQVLMCETICKLGINGVCHHEGECQHKIMLQVQLVNELSVLIDHVFRIDSVKVLLYITPNHQIGLGVLRGISTTWRDNTPVVLQFQQDQIDIMRLATEYWANDKSFCKPSDVCRVVSLCYDVDLAGLVNYMSVNANYTNEMSDEVTENVKAFVHARLSGTNLAADCVLCFEPLRSLPQVRLGCVCGKVGSVKGCMLHLNCAQIWLKEQANIWEASFRPDDPAPAQGPDAPTCPVCIQRLQGVAPFTTDLIAGSQPRPAGEVLPVVKIINVEDDELTFRLYEEMDRKVACMPSFRTEANGNTMRVDQSLLYALITSDKCAERFPSSEKLYSYSRDDERRVGVFPGPATSVTTDNDLTLMGVEKYNNKLYYSALGCWLRWTRQLERNGLADAVP